MSGFATEPARPGFTDMIIGTGKTVVTGSFIESENPRWE
jgi:hypothetical protein